MQTLWKAYYCTLWSVRCYLWNPFVAMGNRCFDGADTAGRNFMARRSKTIHLTR